MAYLCHTATTAHLVLHTLTKSYKGNSTICTARAARFLWASYMSSLDCRIRWCLGLSFIDDPHLPTHSQVSDTCSETHCQKKHTGLLFSARLCSCTFSAASTASVALFELHPGFTNTCLSLIYHISS